MNWDVSKINQSGIDRMDIRNLEFGMLFTDHMIECDFKDGKWGDAHIKPVEELTLHPATHVFHYGQAVFEGLKAYRLDEGKLNAFRLTDNLERLNRSLERMAMPKIDVSSIRDLMIHWLDMERNWVPGRDYGTLYIRPFVISTSHMLRAVPSKEYKFMVIAGPVGFYYDKPIRVKLERKFARSSRGGVGYAKAAGNYGAAFMPSQQAKAEGFDQLIWTDRSDDAHLEELGSANLFMLIDGEFYTPALHDSILAGITRDSVVRIIRDLGYKFNEEMISTAFLETALKEGRVQSMFATGTAAAVTFIKDVDIDGAVHHIPGTEHESVLAVKNRLFAIRFTDVDDPYGWNEIV